MNHDSPAEIRIALETAGVALKKRWGQNFMVNRGARGKIVRLLDSKSGELVWEVGAGPVSYTHLTLPTNREV